MKIDKPKEYWLRLISKEGDEPISAGVQRDCDALWQCQMLAAIGIEETNDTGPLADIFAAIHRTAAGQLTAKGPAINQEAPAQQWRGIESEVTQADVDAAERILGDLCAPMTDLVLQDMAGHISKIRQAAYAAGRDAERERIINQLRSDAVQTEIDARRILGKLIKLTPADTDDWAKLVAMKYAIADIIETSGAAIRSRS